MFSRFRAASAVALAAVTLATTACIPAGPKAPPAPPTSRGGTEARITTDHPDPDVLRVGGDYYTYSTNTGGRGNVPVSTSRDLKNWVYKGDALLNVGTWAHSGRTWAPAVAQFGPNFVMYYTAHDRASGLQCIGRATSTSPVGPFTDRWSTPLICQRELGGSIDADTYQFGFKTWVLWKSDENAPSRNKPSRLWSRELTQDGLSLTGAPAAVLLTKDRAWETPLIEQPSMVYEAGKFWLFYSANWWESDSYATGYAVCDSPSGPCTKVTVNAAFHASTPYATGPGAMAWVKDPTGSTYAIYHGWTNKKVGYGSGGVRGLFADRVTFTANGPQMRPDLGTNPIDPDRPHPLSVMLSGDFDGDKKDDVFSYSPGPGQETIAWGTADRAFDYTTVGVRQVTGSYRAIAGDFNGDGRDDVYFFAEKGTDSLWLGGTNRQFTPTTPQSAEGPYQPIAGDFNGDNIDDIFWYHPGGPTERVWFGSKTLAFRSVTVNVPGTFTPVVGDFDGDSYDDVLWYRPGTGTELYWYGSKTGAFTASVAPKVDGTYKPVASDVDGDGDSDIVWGGAHQTWISEGRRTPTMKNAPLPTNTFPVAGDFDGDRTGDVLWWRPHGPTDELWYHSPFGQPQRTRVS